MAAGPDTAAAPVLTRITTDIGRAAGPAVEAAGMAPLRYLGVPIAQLVHHPEVVTAAPFRHNPPVVVDMTRDSTDNSDDVPTAVPIGSGSDTDPNMPHLVLQSSETSDSETELPRESGRTAFSSSRRRPRGRLTAKYNSACPVCRLMISPGDAITLHNPSGKYAHAQCVQPTQRQAVARPITRSRLVSMRPSSQVRVEQEAKTMAMKSRLSPGYRSEVNMWIKFHGQYHVPGIHMIFDTSDIQDYLRFRAAKTKGFAGILSALKQMGMLCGYSLHSSKYQQPSAQFQVLQHTINKLRKQRRDQGLDNGVNQAIALGKFGIGLLLSALSCYSYKQFRRLNQAHRENLTVLGMIYSGCARFGLFHYEIPKSTQITFVGHSNAYRLEATWRKTHKSNRPYSINFPLAATADSPGFVVQHPSGPTVVTTGLLIHWYTRTMEEQLLSEGTQPFFPTLHAQPDRRHSFSKWLKDMFKLLLPQGSAIPTRIRPHSPRAGWVCDRVRAQVPAETIMAEGRWGSRQAMQQYIRTMLRDLCRTNNFRYIAKQVRRHWAS